MSYISRLLFLFMLLSSILTTAQTKNLKEIRDSSKLVLAVGSGTFYETDIKASRYINGPNILQIYPGEKAVRAIPAGLKCETRHSSYC